MNKLITSLFVLFSVFIMTSCLGDDEPKDKVKDIMMYVSYETGFLYDLFDSDSKYPVECMRVMSEDDPGVWHELPFGAIEGFTYERGHEYDLLLKRTILANPPADASNRTYKLVRIINDNVYKEPKPDEPEVPVTTEADIKYQEKCPFNKYGLYKSHFEVNSNGDLYYDYDYDYDYDEGKSTPGYDATRIYLEVVLDKADPDFLEFNSIPYMAYRSYVFSPFTDEIRLIYNESDGPMFKTVIPEAEYRYIRDKVETGAVLHYTLFLVNIYKLGLQKLEFTVTKI